MLGMVRFFFDLHQIKPHGPPTLEGVNGGKGGLLKPRTVVDSSFYPLSHVHQRVQQLYRRSLLFGHSFRSMEMRIEKKLYVLMRLDRGQFPPQFQDLLTQRQVNLEFFRFLADFLHFPSYHLASRLATKRAFLKVRIGYQRL